MCAAVRSYPVDLTAASISMLCIVLTRSPTNALPHVAIRQRSQGVLPSFLVLNHVA